MHNGDGEQVWERKLDAFGKAIVGDNSSCPFMYQGQYYDAEIDLAYNRFRYYDPEDGRYISVDPIGLNSGEYNLYNYVSDPNGFIDIFGLAGTYAQLKKNQKNGKLAEQKVLDKLRKNPNVEVLATQVYVKTPGLGRGRYVDILIRNKKTNKIVAVEVKSGNAVRGSKQIAKDNLIDSGSGVFGKKAPAGLAGQSSTNVVSSQTNVPLWSL